MSVNNAMRAGSLSRLMPHQPRQHPRSHPALRHEALPPRIIFEQIAQVRVERLPAPGVITCGTNSRGLVSPAVAECGRKVPCALPV